MVREGRAAPASGQLRYTASAGSHENSRGSGRAHGRLSSAAADGHVYRPRDATPFVQRVLGRPPVAPSRRPPPRLPARGMMDKLSRSRGDAVFVAIGERSMEHDRALLRYSSRIGSLATRASEQGSSIPLEQRCFVPDTNKGPRYDRRVSLPRSARMNENRERVSSSNLKRDSGCRVS